MFIEKLDISNVRNLASVSIKPGPGINFFYGDNGSGKTAVLEAIHLLSLAKSFRNPRTRDLISYGADDLTVTTELHNEKNRVFSGLQKNNKETQIKYGGKKITRTSEQARNIPLIVVSEESHKILDGGPKDRRHWLDWSMFHVEPHYIGAWQQYYLALRHRNALLRQYASDQELDLWEKMMVESAAKLTSYKSNYLKNMVKSINSVNDSPFKDVEVFETYDGMEGLETSLIRGRDRDKDMGYTRHGPHRADIVIKIEGKMANKTLSRGQAKLFLIFLKTRQAVEYIRINSKSPIVLVDDIGAELDAASTRKALAEMEALGTQLFINAVLQHAAKTLNGAPQLFHVKHGEVRKMVE